MNIARFVCFWGGALGRLWGPLGPFGGPLGDLWDPFGGPWGAFGGSLGSLWDPSGAFWGSLGPLWSPLGVLWGALGSFGGPLGFRISGLGFWIQKACWESCKHNARKLTETVRKFMLFPFPCQDRSNTPLGHWPGELLYYIYICISNI